MSKGGEKMGLTSNVPIGTRLPYFVKCDICGVEIEDYDKTRLRNRLKIGGWKYNFKDNKIHCWKCVKELGNCSSQ